MMSTVPLMPMVDKLARPRKAKPMCATLELPMSRFKLRCRMATNPQ
jgi:hypothetical protein